MTLNLPRLEPPRAYFVNPSTGRPLAFGTVTFYSAGTTTLKDVYLDRTGVVPAANPVSLDAAGSCEVFLSGPYRVEVKDANGVVVLTADQLNSIPVELPEGNPGSFIIANNLSEGDPALMREVLELSKQTGTFDATSGRVLLVGAGGLLGKAGALSVGQTLDELALWSLRKVASAEVATVGGPTGAGDGVVVTMPYDDTHIAQVYYPVSGSSPSPWRRMLVVDTWTDWRRDYAYASGTAVHGGGNGSTDVTATYHWSAYGDGRLVLRQSGCNFEFMDGGRLAYDWAPPAGMPDFVALPHVTAAVRTSTAQFIGAMTSAETGAFGSAMIAAGDPINCVMWRGNRDLAFTPGDAIEGVRLCAEGRWVA